jgi:hypothetical protein
MNQAILDRLLRAARAAQFVFRGELTEELGLDLSDERDVAQLDRALAAISRAEVAIGRPMLSSLAVSAEDHLPGPAFFELGEALGLVEEGETPIAFAERQVKLTHDYWRETPAFGSGEGRAGA